MACALIVIDGGRYPVATVCRVLGVALSNIATSPTIEHGERTGASVAAGLLVRTLWCSSRCGGAR
jgi:hypothetical protein